MKILAFTDVHLNQDCLKEIKKKALKYKPSFMVCCGDLSFFTSGLDKAAKFINSIGIKTFIIPGNHESPEDIKNICKKYNNLINLHRGFFEFNDLIFFGWGTGGFSFIEEEFEKLHKQFKDSYDKKKKVIFVTHAPIYKTKLDKLSFGHRGCKSTRKFVENIQPSLVLCGHFHENFGKKDKIKNSLIVNPDLME